MPEKLVTLSQRTTPDASTKNQYGSTRTDRSLEAPSGPRPLAGVPSNLLEIQLILEIGMTRGRRDQLFNRSCFATQTLQIYIRLLVVFVFVFCLPYHGNITIYESVG